MIWIDKQQPFDDAMARVAAETLVSVDTEADSLHSYFDKVCLVQISIPTDDFVIDPLQQIDLAQFGALLANPNITKILHGADYDLRILNRDFGFTMSNVIDTMVCSQLLGYESIGLAALLERHFGIKLDKAHQRADWAMRPLPPDMLGYAASDTHHLIALAAILRNELTNLGRWDWALEEFSRLEMIRFRDEEEPEKFRRLKGIGTFDRRSLAIARELHEWRDGLARVADRPPFKIIGNDVIIEVAKAKAQSLEAFASIKAMSLYHRNRYGREIARLVRKAMQLDESALPERGETRPWNRDKELEGRINRMKSARDRVAKELKIDASVLAPRHMLTAIAQSGTLDIPAMRDWQKKVVGPALLDALG
jgi:ribonuclease D